MSIESPNALPDQFSDQEAARRRDEVVRRMLATPPQPHAVKARPSGQKESTGAGRKSRKPAETDRP